MDCPHSFELANVQNNLNYGGEPHSPADLHLKFLIFCFYG